MLEQLEEGEGHVVNRNYGVTYTRKYWDGCLEGGRNKGKHLTERRTQRSHYVDMVQ
jgi:hypothetical protein